MRFEDGKPVGGKLFYWHMIANIKQICERNSFACWNGPEMVYRDVVGGLLLDSRGAAAVERNYGIILYWRVQKN